MRIFSEFAERADSGDTFRAESGPDRIRANLADIGATLLIASAKGGVGKSIITANVGGALARRGRKVAIVDADLNSPSIIGMLGMKQPRGLPLVEGIEPAAGPHGLRVISSDLLASVEPPPVAFVEPENEPLPTSPARPTATKESDALFQMLTQARLGALDFALVDLAPGIEDLYAVARMVRPHGIVMVSHSSAQSVKATQQAVRVARRIEIPVLGLIENMAGFNCDGCRSVRPLMPEGSLAGAASDLELPVIGRLPFDPRLAEASDRGRLFIHEFADSPLAKILVEIATTIERLVPAQRRA
ncbi:MAG: P-loop NTPase [Deltaproteobacteria bacterium]|jgi:ATP-binding protein involved in chromosome partitioning|nr:P-loop NTPase [Deltaproteobacteria bacterium]